LGFTTLQSWKYRIDLMSGHRHHYEIIGGFLVELVGDAHLGTLTRFEYDALVSLQLLKPKGIWARNHGRIMAGTSELVGECTTDFTGTDDGNRQRRFSCGSYIFHGDFTFDSFSSAISQVIWLGGLRAKWPVERPRTWYRSKFPDDRLHQVKNKYALRR
jgi:hypothetical protein